MWKKFREAYISQDWLAALEAGFEVRAEDLTLVEAGKLYEVGARSRSVVGFPLIVEAFKVFFGPKRYRSFLVSNLYWKDGRVVYAMAEVSENPGILYSDLIEVVRKALGKGLYMDSPFREEDRIPPSFLPPGIKYRADSRTQTPWVDIPGTLKSTGGEEAILKYKEKIQENMGRKLLDVLFQKRAGVDRVFQRVFSGKVAPKAAGINHQLSMDGQVLVKDSEERVFLGTCKFIYPLLREVFQVGEPDLPKVFSAHVIGEEGDPISSVSGTGWFEEAQHIYEEGDLSVEQVLEALLGPQA